MARITAYDSILKDKIKRLAKQIKKAKEKNNKEHYKRLKKERKILVDIFENDDLLVCDKCEGKGYINK